MRIINYPIMFSIMLLLFGARPAEAADGIVTPSQGADCRTLSSNREEAVWTCPGPAGAFVQYTDFTTRAGLTFGWGRKVAKPVDADDLSWSPSGSGLASRMEWRINNGRPFAAIIGRWRQADEAGGSPAFEELMVIRLAEEMACSVAVLGALAPDAMATARRIADERAPRFRCGIDKPIGTSLRTNAQLRLWDDHFHERETFHHNGSIVELTRHAEGSIEIRYVEPRKELKVEPGMVLFRGTARNGELKGEAFLFRPGCAPASYTVAGERKDGVLVLEGRAPQRAPGSCLVTPYSAKPSRLTFEHEPVLQPSLALSPSAGLPSIADCSNCTPATIRSVMEADTDAASIVAEITESDIKRHCEGHEKSAEGQSRCANENAGQIGKFMRSTANCNKRTIEPSAGGRFKFYKMGEDYGGPAPVWINLDKNQIECGSRACTGPSASAQFALMCPSAIPGWKGHWANHD